MRKTSAKFEAALFSAVKWKVSTASLCGRICQIHLSHHVLAIPLVGLFKVELGRSVVNGFFQCDTWAPEPLATGVLAGFLRDSEVERAWIGARHSKVWIILVVVKSLNDERRDRDNKPCQPSISLTSTP